MRLGLQGSDRQRTVLEGGARLECRMGRVNGLRETLAREANWLYTHNAISEKTYVLLIKVLNEVARKLISKGHIRIPGTRVAIKLLKLREYNGGDFHMPIIVTRLRPKQGITCFVGHRDTPEMQRSFQYNLTTILGQFRIMARFQDVNYLTDLIFQRIKREIVRSHFCIFDSRGTQKKPNVYVEIGMAKMADKPIVFFEKRTKSSQQLEGFPSDFSGFSTFRYRSYKDLFVVFALQLPVLLREMNLY